MAGGGFLDRILGTKETQTEVEDTCCKFKCDNFCELMATNLYSKVLHEAADRAVIPEEITKSSFYITIYDNYSPYKIGLVSWVVKALTEQSQIFLEKKKLSDGTYIFERITNTNDAYSNIENKTIKPNVIELDFRKFKQYDLLCLMFELLQGILEATSKNVTIANALILKIHELTKLTENSSNNEALRLQLEQLNTAIREGRAGFIDAQSNIEFVNVDTKPNEEAASFVFSMIANVTGLPKSWVYGLIVGGLGSQEQGDEKALDDAIKYYYFSIMHGVLYAVYDKSFEYKQTVTDVASLVSMLAFVETTTLLTPEGKKKFMLNNTGFLEEDLNLEGTNTSSNVNSNSDNSDQDNSDQVEE